MRSNRVDAWDPGYRTPPVRAARRGDL